MARRFLQPLCLLGLLTLASGCGLDDYEKKMRETQVKLQDYDEEEITLGPALLMPRKLNPKTMQQVPIPGTAFVRGPKGIHPMPEKEPREGIFYRYLPPTNKKADPFKLVEVAYWVYGKKKEEGESKEDFEKKVKAGQRAFTNKVLACFSLREKDKLEERKLRQSPFRTREGSVIVKSIDFDDPNGSYSLNIMDGKEQSVAVVFWIQKGKKDEAKLAIQQSLGWLALESGVASARDAFARRNPLLILPPQPKP
jgi:hypothetical protein